MMLFLLLMVPGACLFVGSDDELVDLRHRSMEPGDLATVQCWPCPTIVQHPRQHERLGEVGLDHLGDVVVVEDLRTKSPAKR